jgi:ATP-dependent exoDNAse (exonuclease V) beta subunit
VNPPSIVSAGAGSGKTYRITDEVERLVAQEGIAIDRIAAVTFTDAAAAELQERIRERLVEKGLLDAARRVDAAPIRTIHAFALSLLTENPLEAGLSPSPLVLGDVEQGALLARAVNEALADDSLRPAIARLTRDHCQADPRLRRNQEDFLRNDAKTLCEHLRALRLGPGDLDRVIADNAADLADAFGPTQDPKVLDAALRAGAERARQFITDFPDGKGKGDRPHAPKLRALVDTIFADGPGAFDLRVLGTALCSWSKANKPFLAAAEPLTLAVDVWMRRHPRVLERLQRDAADLLTVAFGVLGYYQRAKADSGALDYEDMQSRALDLLEKEVEGAPFAAYVAQRITHLVVDEFQDTSPLQFRIAETLRAHGTRTLYVGDPRQGIYAFRGADSRLLMALEATEERAGRAPSRLIHNWRSRPELVELVNALFGRLFPKVGLSYTALTPSGPYAKLGIAKGRPSFDVVVAKPAVVLARIQEILADPTFQVLDRRTQELRRIRPGDLAILCPINDQLDGWAKRLAEAGIRSVRELSGWSERLEVRLTCAALAALANPLSSAHLAALHASEVYGVRQREIAKLAAAGVFNGPRRLTGTDDAAFDALVSEADLAADTRAALVRFREDFAALSAELRARSLPDFVQAVVERLQLEPVMAAKGLGAQARANLVRLVEHARAFAAVHERGLEALGASAVTVENFLYYLEAVVKPSGDAQPEPVPEDDGALKLVSYHGAKGLEWPVVVLPGLGRSIAPRLARMEVVRPEAAEDLVGPRLFELSRLRVFPHLLTGCPGWSVESDLAAAKGGDAAARAEHARLLYVALTRAREHLVLGWDDEPETDSQQALLSDLGGLRLKAGALAVGDETFAAHTVEPSAMLAEAEAPAPADREGVRAALRDGTPLAHDPAAFVATDPAPLARAVETSPTELCHVADDPVQARLARRGATARYPVSGRVEEVALSALAAGTLARVAGDAERSEIGRLVHLALEHGDAGFGGRADAELKALLRLSATDRVSADALVSYALAALGSVRALARELGATEMAREIPFILARGPHRITGFVDLALLAPDGWHVLDHKVHPIGTEHVPQWAAFYRPQLDAYAVALAALTGRAVVGRHLLFHTTGVRASYVEPVDPGALDRVLEEMSRGI